MHQITKAGQVRPTGVAEVSRRSARCQAAWNVSEFVTTQTIFTASSHNRTLAFKLNRYTSTSNRLEREHNTRVSSATYGVSTPGDWIDGTYAMSQCSCCLQSPMLIASSVSASFRTSGRETTCAEGKSVETRIAGSGGV